MNTCSSSPCLSRTALIALIAFAQSLGSLELTIHDVPLCRFCNALAKPELLLTRKITLQEQSDQSLQCPLKNFINDHFTNIYEQFALKMFN